MLEANDLAESTTREVNASPWVLQAQNHLRAFDWEPRTVAEPKRRRRAISL